MEVLTLVKAMLERDAGVMALIKGSINLNKVVVQQGIRPDIVLMLMGGADGWTQSGPHGLFQQTVRIYYRGDSDEEATLLAKAGTKALNGRTAMAYGMEAKQCRRTNSVSDYNDEASVHRQIDSYVVAWGYSS